MSSKFIESQDDGRTIRLGGFKAVERDGFFRPVKGNRGIRANE